jgi:drug/metabolite transporter superfamily protein YnfA
MDLNVITSKGERYTLPIQQNNDLVRDKIIQNEHPHPLLIIFIVIIMLLIIYYIHVLTLRNYSGKWYAKYGDCFIRHNIWDNNISADFKGYTKVKGEINGLGIILNSPDGKWIGVIDGKKIFWTNGDIWQQPELYTS